MLQASPPPSSNPSFLCRVPLVFSSLAPELFKRLDVGSSKKLGQDYYLVKLPSTEVLRRPEAELLISWNLPVHHAWPCDPQNMPGFVEKSAQALFEKFRAEKPQAILIGALHPGPAHQYYRRLASNLRGRVLQLFPDLPASRHEAEEQDPAAPTLFCLVGREGLYAGVQSPSACRGFYPGGTKFIKQSGSASISRAGAKVAEALHHLRLHRPPLREGSHWLELGASPGGMTSELLARKYRVTAVDRAALDGRLRQAEGLAFVQEDVAAFLPRAGEMFDALLCDLNGGAMESMKQVTRLAPYLRKGAPVVFTLKLPGMQTLSEIVTQSESAIRLATSAGLLLLSRKHLSYNRHEFTLFFEPTPR
jgi:23S rRNA (cytidine2498-2'-O)-methyltransferase